MPTGPEKGENRIKQEYEKICQIIDKWLEENDKGQDQIRVFTRLSTISTRVQALLIEAYLNAGWRNVKFKDDQREGCYVILYRC